MWSVESTTTVAGTGVPAACYTLSPTTDGHLFAHYSASSAANVRGGHLHIVWDVASGRVEWSDVGTDDIGDTSALVTSVTYSAGVLTVYAASSAGTWTVNMLVVASERG